MKITLEWLIANHACRAQVDLFKQVYPDGAKLTKAELRRAIDHGFDLDWLVTHVLGGPTSSAGMAYDDATEERYDRYLGGWSMASPKWPGLLKAYQLKVLDTMWEHLKK